MTFVRIVTASIRNKMTFIRIGTAMIRDDATLIRDQGGFIGEIAIKIGGIAQL